MMNRESPEYTADEPSPNKKVRNAHCNPRGLEIASNLNIEETILMMMMMMIIETRLNTQAKPVMISASPTFSQPSSSGACKTDHSQL
jgi:hypothetical protein